MDSGYYFILAVTMPEVSTMSGFELEPQGTTSVTPGQPTSSPTSNTPPNISSNPSLILAFLALSFFTMAMVFIFGFRRYQYFQERLHEVFGRADPNRPSEQQAAWEIRLRGLPGTRPKLWDVTTNSCVRWCEVKTRGVAGRKAGGEVEALWNWDDVMPLSASNVTDADEVGTVPFRSSRAPNPVSSNIFRRYWRFGATPSPRSSDKNSKHTKSLTTLSPMSRLRLAVLVAMPSERYPIYDRELREDTSRHERGTFGYELGLYEVPYDDDDDDNV